MITKARHLNSLTVADFKSYKIWTYAPCKDNDETCVRPVKRDLVSDLTGKLVATQVTLANKYKPWAIIGNIDLANKRLTKHFVTLTLEHNSQWFHLARYHDHDYHERGPKQLAEFLNLKVNEIFPIFYDVSASVSCEKAAATGLILLEPDEKLSRAEIISLAVL
jgi:hypothetical protein